MSFEPNLLMGQAHKLLNCAVNLFADESIVLRLASDVQITVGLV